jgi:hypothetical protein
MKAVEGRPNTRVFIWRKFHTGRHLRARTQNFPYAVLLAEIPDYDRVFKALSDRNRPHDAKNLEDQRLLFCAPDVHCLLHLFSAQPALSKPVIATERRKLHEQQFWWGPGDSAPLRAPDIGAALH